ncbi:hypothetical protein CR513_12313, partial [Mucuna pruriens]
MRAATDRPFSEEIDRTPTPANFRELVVDLFDRSQDPHTHLQAFQALTFSDLATLFISQFATNKVKRLEVADLFNIKQAKGENLKEYPARFNSAMIRVNDLDQKSLLERTENGGSSTTH